MTPSRLEFFSELDVYMTRRTITIPTTSTTWMVRTARPPSSIAGSSGDLSIPTALCFFFSFDTFPWMSNFVKRYCFTLYNYFHFVKPHYSSIICDSITGTVKTRVIHYLRQAPNLRAQRQKPPRRISAFLIQSSASTLSVLDLIDEYSLNLEWAIAGSKPFQYHAFGVKPFWIPSTENYHWKSETWAGTARPYYNEQQSLYILVYLFIP